ncbi:PAS domain-containing hybrid sensor histidine kinase/response regulator [Pseudovibrio sp. POLY-S9]|uniref:PAS domain-containing hybrid sensor histidine kinase/response regulator n=1 Tax=Pseudovibrio sp. POLY-S9 TaxID=1576596 RepID=UPI000AE80417|nr:PAS domain-containing hybrid sensor histidine kinase/response regulator [Pseudovibrio sp. POLY-S9]
MLQGWIVVLVALAYILLLFVIASYGDKVAKNRVKKTRGRPLIYALSLSVYCTSWTFFGSVGSASRNGFEFIAIYLGPILVFAFGFPLILRVIQLAKAEKITSVADFIAARYGKNPMVGAIVTLIAFIGMIPYIALQLKALDLSVGTIVLHPLLSLDDAEISIFGDETLMIAIFMAVFTWLFGTRHIDATEHQEGLMLSIATEAVVKLVAFLAIGIWVTFMLFDGPWDLLHASFANTNSSQDLFTNINASKWAVITLLSLFSIVLLPRQFHVTVTEYNSEAELKRATWLFPSYLIAINLFVVPIALAGMTILGNTVDPDMFVLALPRAYDADWLTLLVFIGGLSAATAMVIVTTVALSIMVSNDLVMPIILRRRSEDEIISTSGEDMSQLVLGIRRMSIFLVILGSYVYYRVAGDSAALSSIGLLSFAAIAQFAPAFIGGLIWRRATARGAIASMTAGFAVWFYTLLLPVFARESIFGSNILSNGPFGIEFLKPEALLYFDMDPFVHGVLWSLLSGLLFYVVFSLTRQPTAIERIQANTFVPTGIAQAPALRKLRTTVTIGDLQATISRYVGEERTQRSFDTYAAEHRITIDSSEEADAVILRFSEQLLASAIGSASARLVLSLLLKRRDPGTQEAIKLLDDATEAIQYNRDLLQIALDQVRQGISVYDKDLRLICWNRQYREMLMLPAKFGQVGTSLEEMIRHIAEAGEFGDGDVDEIVGLRMHNFINRQETYQEHLVSTGTVLEVRTSPMPYGGLVTSYTDITERVFAEEALARANENLEQRVRDRTEELTKVNEQLEAAKKTAELAYQDKTRFLAAASHDILQPLNAARLYSSTLTDRFMDGDPEDRKLVSNIEASLESVEEIIGAVLDISRLDTRAFKAEISTFRLDDILNPLRVEFTPIAKEKGLKLTIRSTDVCVRSDRRLLRRLLQNLISNGLKYTTKGGVVVGVRKTKNNMANIEVYDSGIGIPEKQQELIFKEFRRLDDGARIASGLGLGLSIVERISKVLALNVALKSQDGRGSRFSLAIKEAMSVPVAVKQAQPSAIVSQLAGLNVLAIDNEPQILEGMESLLRTWKCNVLTAPNAQDAAKAIYASKTQPDIILADYHLDQGTGIEAVVHLRWKFGVHFPAMLITADRTAEVRTEASDKDMEMIHKPLKPAVLRAHLMRCKAALGDT